MITQTEKEKKEFLSILKWYAKEVKHNKKLARKLLVDAGIFTKKGNLRKPYRHLCIP